ncbi:hypothetical protein N657DRAFT_679059 [Parathielavia appendiculata]|uniref:Uncharacterized protein n=1 Tax=Parathielavia appendiculata TaxID=2587402 RepID=A0AAN6U407_9PEZI|nr:hypothetical protein N657DRAFT_679059 [Parathielavia appendiculata]
MSWFKQLSVEAGLASEPELTKEACDKLSKYVPQTFSLKELADEARGCLSLAHSEKPGEVQTLRNYLVSILTCLYFEGRIVHESTTDQDTVRNLARNIAKTIAPVVTPEASRSDNTDSLEAPNQDFTKIRRAIFENCRAISSLGVRALEALMNQTEDPVRLDDEVLYTLLVYTDKTQPWENCEIKASTQRLLEQQFSVPGSPTKEQFLTETLLKHYLRPLFFKSKPSSITTSGRKAEYTDGAAARAESMPDESALTKPWKYTDLRAIPAVAWAVREADTQLIAKHWPLFIPVLLTLVDDPATLIRRRGLLILTDFLAKFSDKTLHDTGLAKVFEDAIFPTLAFLPSLTPEDESLQLLGPAYGALLSLANKQPALSMDGISGGPRNALLDKVLRDGVFMGYFHAKEHVEIVAVLCQQTVAVLTEMGVHAVKHLKDLIPMLSSIMTDPFAPVAPKMLLSAIKAMQAVLANCWPRIPVSLWQDEIINALVLCWLNVAEHDHADTDKHHARIEQELLTSSKALAAVLKTASREGEQATNLSSHVAPLVTKEPRLGKLFPPN